MRSATGPLALLCLIRDTIRRHTIRHSLREGICFIVDLAVTSSYPYTYLQNGISQPSAFIP